LQLTYKIFLEYILFPSSVFEFALYCSH